MLKTAKKITLYISIVMISMCLHTASIHATDSDQIIYQIQKNISKKYKLSKKLLNTKKYKNIGMHKITYYCPSCNSPSGSHQSSSGVRLKKGHAACSWLPIGTVIKVKGKVYKVVDRCGTKAIDIFKNTKRCRCNSSYYTKVKRRIKK